MKTNQLTNWLLGAMLALVLILWGSLYAANTARLDRIETKVDAIQSQYIRIADISERLNRLERQIDQLLQQLR